MSIKKAYYEHTPMVLYNMNHISEARGPRPNFFCRRSLNVAKRRDTNTFRDRLTGVDKRSDSRR
jgi:hypothetical protein